jgi:antitoxin CptB
MPARAVKHRHRLVPICSETMTSLQEQRRRAHYRAAHRGTREMDWLLGRYAEAAVPAMSHGDLMSFERLLTVPDPALHGWIVLGEIDEASEFAPLILAIRKFHGLGPGQ